MRSLLRVAARRGNALVASHLPVLSVRFLCAEKPKKEGINVDFRETLRKVQSDASRTSSSSSSRSDDAESVEGEEQQKESTQEQQQQQQHQQQQPLDLPAFLNKVSASAREAYASMQENIKEAYAEMTGGDSANKTSLRRKVEQAQSYRKPKKAKEEGEEGEEEEEEDEFAAKKEAGPSALVLVKEPTSQWERMRQRLEDSAFIRDILKRAKVAQDAASQTDLGKQAQRMAGSVRDKLEDAREFWETSQNPLVYKMSEVWDKMTGETEEGIATKEILKLDPSFMKEEWANEVKENLAPLIIKAHLVGDTAALRPWLGEGVYNKLAADIRVRKADGIVIDSNILAIDEVQTVVSLPESTGVPVVVVVYMVQQINCIRNRENEIIEVRLCVCV